MTTKLAEFSRSRYSIQFNLSNFMKNHGFNQTQTNSILNVMGVHDPVYIKLTSDPANWTILSYEDCTRLVEVFRKAVRFPYYTPLCQTVYTHLLKGFEHVVNNYDDYGTELIVTEEL